MSNTDAATPMGKYQNR